ncbi:alcohol dehydrogenase catalytic domain-containing protein [Mycobacterium sp.]|uniref:alcohol dehydrogenase catalytic domain-containing protein n=1 Tax=Mycobacterium sp. TaxID=1785 RepID=UPI003D6BE0BD
MPEPQITQPQQALVRPLMVACCDLDVVVSQGLAPMAPGYAIGHEGLAEVLAVGSGVTTVRVHDRVVVPFQISCGECRECRRGITGSCASVPPLATYGMGTIAGLDGGGFFTDVVLVPFADAMLIPVPETVDPVAIASLSDNIPDGWRGVGPYQEMLTSLEPADRRVLVVGGLSIGLYAAAFAVAYGAQVDYIDTDSNRLAAAERMGAHVHDCTKPQRSWGTYPVVVHTAADPARLTAALRATWAYGVCTDHGIYFHGPVQLPLLEMYTRGVQLITGRVNARALIPEVIDLISQRSLDLAPIVNRVIDWDDTAAVWPTMTGKTVFTRVA